MNNSIAERASIAEIRSIKLTQWGRLRLQSFTDDAIRFADDNLESHKAYSFNAFLNLCVLYSKNNNNRIDWKIGYDLVKDMPQDASLVEYRVHRQAINNGSSVSSQGSRRRESQKGEAERLIDSANKYQTVRRPFYGLPETLEQPEVSSPIEQLSEHTKERGNDNPYPTVDSGFSSDYCMKELNFFAARVIEQKQNDRHHKTFGIGNTLAYLERIKGNWEKQYFFALKREQDESDRLLYSRGSSSVGSTTPSS